MNGCGPEAFFEDDDVGILKTFPRARRVVTELTELNGAVAGEDGQVRGFWESFFPPSANVLLFLRGREGW